MQILVRKQAILNNLIEMCSKLHQKLRDGNTRSRYFNTWVQMGTDKEVLYEAFHSIYIERAIERLFFRRWNRLMHKKRLRRLESRIRKRYSSILKTKEEESLQIIQDLEAELATAKSELQKSQENFNQMQDRLKKAFLRGVVNLNIEAMDAFDGAPFANENSEVESQSTIEDDFIDYDDDDDDDDFYVEDVPSVSVIKHQ
ncbi:centrosomal protein [Histomonas meleagridis]|uniref:centrosomal protein POC5 isoform X1 n=1 Tax=Histomonas meleagridis TaxID=135588 RepID=UPI0035598823|nr:centrosomal protein [Histomonas meleagridis]KAH0796550.1 centrosomal protein POC5 isoform X1 [Histomonas meleagridis]